MLTALRAFAVICAALALLGLMCAGLALGLEERDALSLFGGFSALLLVLAFGIFLAFDGRKADLTQENSFPILIGCWMIAPLLATVPFLALTELPAHLAAFEAASAITTTGATALTRLDGEWRSIILWRAGLQWLGGLATLVSIVVVLAPAGAGGTPLLRIGGDHAAIFRNRVHGVLGVYAALTLACVAALLTAGIEPLDAFALAFSTLSTGGMMPRDGALNVYDAPLAEWSITVFMLLGATSLAWHRLVATGRLGRSITVIESAGIGALVLVLGIAFALAFSLAAGSETVLSLGTALREGLLTASSLVTTTGFEARNAGATVLPLGVVLIVLLIGGGMFSTAGGIKLFRVAIMTRHSVKELEHVLYPHAVYTDHLGRFAYDTDAMRALWTALVVFLAVWAASTILLTFGSSLPVEAALTAALAALVNAGPVYAMGWGGLEAWPGYETLSPLQSSGLSLAMVAGRVEVIGLVAGLSMLLRRW